MHIIDVEISVKSISNAIINTKHIAKLIFEAEIELILLCNSANIE